MSPLEAWKEAYRRACEADIDPNATTEDRRRAWAVASAAQKALGLTMTGEEAQRAHAIRMATGEKPS